MKERIDQLFPQMVDWRRMFHQYPELSYQEKNTSEKIAQFLRELGLEVRTGIGGYGVTGLLKGKEAGPVVALRADMDALPIQDEKNCSYRSKVPGVMHACGHDAHMAMLMGTAMLLSEQKEKLKGDILFIFQPAEEKPPGGAIAMIQDGVLHGVDVIYGIHLWTPLPLGVVGVRGGEIMAASDAFMIEIIGRGGHGGIPHEAIDAVAIASHVVVNLQTIVSRQVDPLKSGVITVGSIQGGNAFNVIADTCCMLGTVRTFDPVIRKMLVERIEEVVKATCQMYGAQYRFEYTYGYPAVINDEQEAQRVANVASQIVGEQQVWHIPPMMPGEDFAYYLERIPGAFCFVGAGNPEKQIVAPHHHPLFDIDEEAMKVGIELFIRLAMDYLNKGTV
ncbi:M20 metallopeptidase family protein [Thermoflavimicrobium dichotomicum]|uniref:Amidohydrolase n=1 Tax=Thermoflavimicrobium dichotomicum TaxID=46223 RepID=A0A1I3MP36_9BACL|nr:M20 family metallopeptidase [Thermoflavimicrobium dichotomicum]SFI98701.1 amidohydrolase [Thermoflavimicrobium dichotomicum]